eukprot:750733-Hanusia_phi.AAC.12
MLQLTTRIATFLSVSSSPVIICCTSYCKGETSRFGSGDLGAKVMSTCVSASSPAAATVKVTGVVARTIGSSQPSTGEGATNRGLSHTAISSDLRQLVKVTLLSRTAVKYRRKCGDQETGDQTNWRKTRRGSKLGFGVNRCSLPSHSLLQRWHSKKRRSSVR